LAQKLTAEKAGKISVGQFIYRDTIAPLSIYWTNQLTEELVNASGRSFTVLSGGQAGADWVISGEIVEVIDTIRVYTRLVRAGDLSIEASFHSDFERSEEIIGMLAVPSGGSGSSSSSVPRDARETDSFDNPVAYEIGADENAAVMNRTIHQGDDGDFFILTPAADGQLTVETTGSLDTYMNLYDADTRGELASNDDGGSSYNARIRRSVQAGKRYIVKVRGYDSGEIGNYGFRAWLQVQVQLAPDEFESDDDSDSAKSTDIGASQQHTFHNPDDVDWIKFQITEPSRYTIRTRGVNSNRLDTYIELYDENMNSIDEDDDGGDGLDSRISLRLDSGLYFLKVECLDDEVDQPYTVNIQAE
jgi:hypothetical protein